MMFYNLNVDLVNENVFLKFGLILSMHSQDIEQNENSDVNQGKYLRYKFSTKMILYNPNVDLVNDNVYTKFVYILSIHSQDIKRNQILKSIKGRNYVVYLKNDALQS